MLTPPLLAGDCVGMHRLRLGPGLQHEPLWDQGTRHGHGADAAQPQERRALRGAQPPTNTRHTHGHNTHAHGTSTGTRAQDGLRALACARTPSRQVRAATLPPAVLPHGRARLWRRHGCVFTVLQAFYTSVKPIEVLAFDFDIAPAGSPRNRVVAAIRLGLANTTRYPKQRTRTMSQDSECAARCSQASCRLARLSCPSSLR